MKAVRVAITGELLLGALHFPSGTEIVGAKYDWHNQVHLTLSHPDLPEVDGEPPFASPTFRRQDEVVFVGWGLPQLPADQSVNVSRRAFTLIELLVVLALIGILAALAIYFVPSFQTSERAARGAGHLQQWLQAARQRAIRDGSPRGVRLQFDLAGYATRAMCLEIPDDLGSGRFYDSTALAWRSYQLATGGNPFKLLVQIVAEDGTVIGPAGDIGIQAGDYLELDGVGLPRQIVGVTASGFVLSTPHTLTTPTKQFRIMRGPRPTGDDVMDLPKSVVVDKNTNDAYGSIVDALPVVAGNCDIMFSPTGTLMPGAFQRRGVFWVRSLDDDQGVPLDIFRGEPTLIVVSVNSGSAAAYPVNLDNPADPYAFVK